MLVNKEVKEKRRKICNNCELLNKDFGLCTHCLCIVKVKTTLKDSQCPIGLW